MIAAIVLLFNSTRTVVVEPAKVVAQTQREMNTEACDRYRKSEAELNLAYHHLLSDYKHNRVFIRKLRAAQRAWVAFRDAHVASVYPDPAPAAYGSVNPLCRCNLLHQLTRERLLQLKQWIDGAEEGDVCAGSIRLKK